MGIQERQEDWTCIMSIQDEENRIENTASADSDYSSTGTNEPLLVKTDLRDLSVEVPASSEEGELLLVKADTTEKPLVTKDTEDPQLWNESGADFWGAVWNVTNTILGSGTLALPFAVYCSGYVLGLIILLFMLLVSSYSLQFLLHAGDRVGRVAKSYESLGMLTMGKIGFYMTQVAFLFGGFGLVMAYMIFIGQLFPPAFTGRAATSAEQTWATIGVTVLVVLPLCLLRNIDSLKHTSFVGVAAVWYVVVFVCVVSWGHVASNGHHPAAKAVKVSEKIFTTSALLTNAFSCHISLLPVYQGLKERNPRNMTKIINTSLLISSAVYVLVAMAGYLHFGEDIKANILNNFWDQDEMNHTVKTLLRGANFSVGLSLTVGLPIVFWPFRSCVLALYRLKTGSEGLSERQLPDEKEAEYSCVEWVGSSVLLLAMVLTAAVVVPSIKVALSIVGSIGGAFIVFILPSSFYMYSGKDRQHKIGPKVMIVVGTFLGSISLFVTLLHVAQTQDFSWWHELTVNKIRNF